MLQIRLLGQFDIRLDGKRVMIPTRAAQSLLAYLVLTAGTPHRREKLAGTFWPDTTDENARKNLRQELWRIRKAFSAQQFSTDEYLLAEELTLTFNRNSEYWLDVSQLERPEIELESLTANLALYQGELLPGFYEEWIMLERERIQSIFETKMDQLLKQLVTAERWTAVQEQGERWLALGHTLEPAYRAIMLAYGARGDMAKVSSTYQRCMEELREQFGLEPSAETRALYDGLLKGTRAPSHTAAFQQSGTVTFLFTDIEESTNLLDKLGNDYATVLAEHHEILRTAIQKWNGHEVDTQGDAFFVTFARAMDAIQCSADAQRALDSHPWLHGKPLRVRMGLHTGEPLIASTGYVGMDVHRAARIGDAAHGGQVLLSQTTRELVVNDLPKDLSIRDLGEHRLKDLKFPTPIYQLIIPGLAYDFPPIRTKFTGSEAPTAGEPPFKGLQYFEEVDSDLFFGRELLTAKLVNRLNSSQFLSVIIGASGSGKSSLVRAGLIPSLKKGQALMDGTKPPEGSTDWRVHIITPTAHPLEALAIELTRDSESVTATSTLMDDLMQDPRSLALFLMRKYPKQHTLLVLDQFEELFTLCRDEFEREAFIDNLLTTFNQSEGHVTLVLTLRADFYAHLAQYPELRDVVAKQQEYIGPMTTEELRRAIEEPARRGQWAFEPGLVDLILRDVGDEPGALPLLSHALLETWKRRAGHTLTLKGYADAGGVHGAIAHTAESMYQNLSPTEQAITHNIFLRLTELGDGTEDTRRRTSMNELISHTDDADEVRAVLNLLAEARLITLGEDTVEVAHEALIREWPTLREWLTQDREGLLLHRQITEAAHEWELLGRDAGSVYRGARLAQAREWAILHPNLLNTGERAFIEASNELEQHEQTEREEQIQRELEAAQYLAETKSQSEMRLRIRNGVISVVGAIALVLAVVAGIFGFQSNQNAVSAQFNAAQAVNAQATAQTESLIRATAETNAIQSAAQSFSRELAVQSELNLNVDTQLSILLALAGLDNAYTHEAENALHKSLQASRELMTLTETAQVGFVTFSPDGKRLASVSKVRDAVTGQELFSFPGIGLIFSPDGRLMASFEAIDQITRVSILDAQTGQKLLTLKDAASSDWSSMNFSPDGQLVIGKAGKIEFFNPTTGQLISTLSSPDWTFKGFNGGPDLPLRVNFAVFSADGKRLAIVLRSDGNRNLGRVELWDYPSRRRLLTLPETFDTWTWPTGFAFSPDGKYIVTGQGDGAPSFLWDATTGEKLYQLSTNSYFYSFTFTPDGKYILTASADGTAQMWETNSGKLMLTLSGHHGAVFQVSVSPSCVSPPAASFEWCGLRLATASADRTIKIWDISPRGGELLTLPGSNFFVNDDWSRVTTFIKLPLDQGGYDDIIQSWDLPVGTSTSTEKLQVANYLSSVVPIESSSLGQRIIQSAKILIATFVDNDQFYKIWDLSSGAAKEMATLCCASVMDKLDGKWIQGIDVSPDGSLLIIGVLQGNVDVWDLRSGEKIKTLNVSKLGDFWSQSLSPDGSMLAIATTNDLQIWDVATGRLISTWPAPEANIMAFTPDGKSLLIGTCLGTVNVLDVATGENKFTLPGFTTCVNSFGFSHDGSHVAVGSESGPLKLWDWNTHEELLQLPFGNASTNIRMQFSSDDTLLMVSAFDADALVQNTVRVYVLPTKDIIALAKSRLTRTLTTEECQKYLHVNACPSAP